MFNFDQECANLLSTSEALIEAGRKAHPMLLLFKDGERYATIQLREYEQTPEDKEAAMVEASMMAAILHIDQAILAFDGWFSEKPEFKSKPAEDPDRHDAISVVDIGPEDATARIYPYLNQDGNFEWLENLSTTVEHFGSPYVASVQHWMKSRHRPYEFRLMIGTLTRKGHLIALNEEFTAPFFERTAFV